MSVYKPRDRRAWRYRFVLGGKVYQGTTRQITREDAEDVDLQKQREVRRRLSGLPILAEQAPRFAIWATTYLKYLRDRGKVRRLDRVEELLRVVLRFWGARPSGRNPKNPPRAGEPYHDLTLYDPIRDPEWIERFDDWIAHRKIRVGTDVDGDPIYRAPSAQTRLHYMSVMSRLYRVAALPRFRKQTGITKLINPFVGIERDKPGPRQVTVTPAQLRAWLAHTPAHAQLAITIAALAPKLRKENILGLRWDRHIDPELRYITVEEHKTVGKTKLPLVVPIGDTLRRLLKSLRDRATSSYVITYRGARVKEIRGAIKQGATAAGLTYGRDSQGVTFHTIRHMAATLLAEVPRLTEAQRSATMGQDLQTTQMYTHLRPENQRTVVNALAKQLQLELVLAEAFDLPEINPALARSTAREKSNKHAKTSHTPRSTRSRDRPKKSGR